MAHRTIQPSPIFNLTANSSYSPITPPVQQIYFQVDTWTGQWLPANPAAAAGSVQSPPFQPGRHIVYAFAVDGQDATSINTGFGGSPNPGQIAAYHFLVAPEPVFRAVKLALAEGEELIDVEVRILDGGTPTERLDGHEVMSDLGCLLETRRRLRDLVTPLRVQPPQTASGNAADLVVRTLREHAR